MENLLSGISKANGALLEMDDLHNSLQNVVAALGASTDVDRCYIFSNRVVDGDLQLFYTQEWCKEGVEVQLGNPVLSNVSYDMFPGLYNQLSAGKTMYGLVRESDNQFFKEVMESQGIFTYLFVPIFQKDEFWGWMGYDNCTDERKWELTEVDALKAVAHNIGLRLGRERAEAEHALSIERFDMSVQASQQGLWEWDIENDRLSFSIIFMEMIGYTHHEFEHTYENWKNRMHPDDFAIVEPTLQAYLYKKIETYTLEFRLLHKKGYYVWIRGSGVAKWDAKGKPVYMVGSHLNINELKHQQETLELQRNDFNKLLNSLGEVVFRLNSSNTLTFLNLYWEDISGYLPAESLSQSIESFFIPEDAAEVRENLVNLKSGKQVSVSFEARLQQKNGHWRWVHVIMKENGTPQEEEYFISGSIMDIHDKKLAEEKEKELAELKASFVSVASHQFRTPLTVIFTNIELIEIMVRSLEGSLLYKIGKSTEQIKNEISRMTELMNNILLVGRYDARQIKFNQTVVSISPLIHSVVNTYFSNRADGREIHIHETPSHRKVVIDELLFTHVLTNLISNAFNYSEGSKNPELYISYTEHDLEICVQDYGIGIPADELEKVFKSFYRASNTISYRGSGLGLVVAKQFMELYNGSIRLESEINVGTKAIFTLPLVEEDKTA
ncbi:MAG: PAS domain-containing protein [Bacteroidetes bacterium]|nr:PAS domain-containing protein [Bacteroidota bacterium]